MKKYLLAGEDDQFFHVQHPDGSKFSIAKNAVGEQVHKRIKALEPVKMADGGEVEDPEADVPAVMPGPEPKGLLESIQDATGLGKFGSDPYGQSEASQPAAARQPAEAVPVQQPEAAPQPAAPVAPAQSINPVSDAYANALAQQEAGIKGMAGAQAQAGQEQAKAYEQQANQIAETQKHYEAAHAQLDAEHKQLMDAITTDKIDPNRLWHNMSTGNKVLAAISVALSGIGAGMQGGKPNMAMEVIQKQIDRDIEAQKMELGKKHTLLSDNLQRYGNLQQATQATMLQMNAITQAKVSQIAARSGSQEAVARSQMMLGQLGVQAAQMKQQMALAQSQAKSIGLGGAEGGIPVGQEPYAMLNDPKYQEKRVLVGDKAYQARDKDAAKDLSKSEALYKPIVQDIDLLKQLGQSGAITSPEGRNRAQAAMKRLAMNVNEFNGYKRFTDVDADTISHMFNNPAAIASILQGQGATNDTLRSLQTKLEAERKQNLLGYGGAQQYKSFKPGI